MVSAHMSEPARFRRGSSQQIFLIALACVGVIGVFYMISRLGPTRKTGEAVIVSKELVARLRGLSDEAVRKWDILKARRIQAKETFSEDDLALIGEAYVSRKMYEERAGVITDIQAPDLKKELDDRKGERLRAESVALEKSADAEYAAGRHPQARALYAEAREREDLINDKYASSASKDIARASRLTTRIRLMTALPHWDSSVRAETGGEEAAKRGDMTAAIALIREALELNTRLDREYTGLTRADSRRTRKLTTRLDTLESDVIRTAAESILKKAEDSAAKGAYGELADMRAEVEKKAEEIKTKYPRSDYASDRFIDPMIRRAQNAAATKEALALRADMEAFDKSVRAGTSNASEQLENLRRSVARIREAYPKSDNIPAESERHIAYLFDHRDEINAINRAVAASLLPIPGRAGLFASKGEVTQRLYRVIMRASASDDDGVAKENFPANAVTREEAMLFCRRLGWILSRPVRLPNEAEFRALAGKPAAASLAKTARCIDTCDGDAAAVPASAPDANGFTDILGNVREWLAPEAGDDGLTGRLAGGCASDTGAQLAALPIQSVQTVYRSKLIGFRFVAETPPSP